MEVTNALPQSSQDQRWSIRPKASAALASKRDSSAIKRTLPQRGQFGRLRLSFASKRGAGTWHAEWTIIVDPPRRTHLTAPSACTIARRLWRHGDAGVKLSWLVGKIWLPGGTVAQRPQRDGASIGTQLVRPDMTQSSILPLA
jgi:hypothetical protein